MSYYPRVLLTEEGMRDGLQIERPDIPVADKIRLLDALSETGLKEIAVGSFVSPRWVPQMACIDELVRGFHPKPGVTYTATALNEMGRERLRQYVPPLSDEKYQAQTAVYLCDVFAQRNINRTIAQQMARWPKAIEEAKAKGAKAAGIGISVLGLQLDRRGYPGRPHDDARTAVPAMGRSRNSRDQGRHLRSHGLEHA